MSEPTERQPPSDAPPPYHEAYKYPPAQAPPLGGYPPLQCGYPPPQATYPPSETDKVSPYPTPLAAAYSPPQMAAPSRQVQNTVLVHQPQATAVVTRSVNFTSGPMFYNCHICHTRQVTRITYKPGVLAWMIVMGMFLVGLFLCPLIWLFCCVPLCISRTQDVYHTCPNCNNQVGVYKRIE